MADTYRWYTDTAGWPMVETTTWTDGEVVAVGNVMPGGATEITQSAYELALAQQVTDAATAAAVAAAAAAAAAAQLAADKEAARVALEGLGLSPEVVATILFS